ncbi:penicillin-binding protein 2 [Microbacterium sp. ZXX196]|uniref:peptidoglycan D,D-transpeptidase FtsI family protein n=1 Tax=Microbacterium sp. ZXX196 TaxID=2609291 RepID=UPI0012B6CF5F|nr:penicillin-binding protein 2 [Microbacterium sp. ZXX196]MTE24394.1 penicillin-binding protein 2 [Microbacterium sp. ZXX196]
MNTPVSHTARRRTSIAAVVVLIVLIAFVVRLFDIQVVRAQELIDDSYKTANFVSTDTILGVRGSIVDSEGQVLASSTVRYHMNVDPAVADDVTRYDEAGEKYVETWGHLAERIGDVLGMTGAEVEQVVDDALAANPDSRYARVESGITTEQYRALLELDAPMLTFEQQKSRTYPNGAVAGNLVGFTSTDEEPLAGYELMQDACLASTDGSVQYQTSGDRGVRIPGTTVETPATDGGTLQLTIDTDLSWYLLQMLKEEVEAQRAQAGSIMVVEVETGEVKAAVDYPTLDPNDPQAVDASERGASVFTRTFEPGSTFKAITTATVLDQGAATPLTPVDASGYEEFDNGAAVGDSYAHGVFHYTLTGAMVDSSNVALSKIGSLVPAETRYDYLKAFGVGEKTSIDFLGEGTGVLRPSEEWDNQTYYATTFGQGYTVTMPQVVSAYQTLANGGVRIPLSIVDSCTAADGTVTSPDLPDEQRVVSEDAADTTVDILENVANAGSVSDLIQVPGYRIAAKTGTAQKSDGNGGYKSGVYFTSLVGMAPADDPQYIVMVSLDEPRRVTSSAATAPAFQKAMTQVLKTYRVPPSDEPFEPLPQFTD